MASKAIGIGNKKAGAKSHRPSSRRISNQCLAVGNHTANGRQVAEAPSSGNSRSSFLNLWRSRTTSKALRKACEHRRFLRCPLDGIGSFQLHGVATREGYAPGYTSALTGISTALTIVKQLNDIDQKVDEASFKLKIAEISSAFAEAKLGLIDAQQELRQKETEIAALKSSLQRKDETVEHSGYRYRCDAEKQPIGTAFCPICMDDGRFVLTVQSDKSGRPYVCPRCDGNFGYLSAFR